LALVYVVFFLVPSAVSLQQSNLFEDIGDYVSVNEDAFFCKDEKDLIKI
jgi:hypothetical protein